MKCEIEGCICLDFGDHCARLHYRLARHVQECNQCLRSSNSRGLCVVGLDYYDRMGREMVPENYRTDKPPGAPKIIGPIIRKGPMPIDSRSLPFDLASEVTVEVICRICKVDINRCADENHPFTYHPQYRAIWKRRNLVDVLADGDDHNQALLAMFGAMILEQKGWIRR